MSSEFTITSNIREVDRALTRLRKDLWPKAFESASKEIGREALREYRRTTATWHHKPDFEMLVDVQGDEVVLLVGTDDEIYKYVDLGTREHIIAPKRPGGVLKFRESYTPKTRPGRIKSYQGGSFGDVVFRKWVIHPGTQAREFTKAIRRKMRNFGRETLVKKRRWQTAMDERVCPVCGPLHGQEVEWDEEFDGGIMNPPAHPRCRCWVVPVTS